MKDVCEYKKCFKKSLGSEGFEDVVGDLGELVDLFLEVDDVARAFIAH